MSLTRTVAPAPNFMYRTDVKYSDANTNFSADGIDLLRAVGILNSKVTTFMEFKKRKLIIFEKKSSF